MTASHAPKDIRRPIQPSTRLDHPATAICAEFSAALRDPSRMLLLQLRSSRFRGGENASA